MMRLLGLVCLLITWLLSGAHAQQYNSLPSPSATINGTFCGTVGGQGCALPPATTTQPGSAICGPGMACGLNGSIWPTDQRPAAAASLNVFSYHVSPSGNDSNSGTILAPFATMTKCKTQMETSATFTGVISSGTLTASGISGTIVIGQQITTGAGAVGMIITGGSGTTWTVNSLGSVGSEAMASTAPKTCYLHRGIYTIASGGFSLTHAGGDDNQVWSYYPGDQINAAMLDCSGVNAGVECFKNDSSSVGTHVIGLYFYDPRLSASFTWSLVAKGNNLVIKNNIFDGANTNKVGYGLDLNTANNALVSGNTFKDYGNFGSNTVAMFFVNTTNSAILSNTFQCDTGFGLYGNSGNSGNIIANNNFHGIGNGGGVPPTCLGTDLQGNGTALIDQGGANEMLAYNNCDGTVQAYCIDAGGNSLGPYYVSDNTMNVVQTGIDLIGGSNGSTFTNANGIVRRNNVTSTGGEGINLGDDNNACPRDSTANGPLVVNNTISAPYEGIYVSKSQNAGIEGNNMSVSTIASGGSSPHYKAGISVVAWQADVTPTPCTVTQNSTGLTIENNIMSNYSANSQYGVVLENAQD